MVAAETEVEHEAWLLQFGFRAHPTSHQGGGPDSDEDCSELHRQAPVRIVLSKGQEVETTGAIQG